MDRKPPIATPKMSRLTACLAVAFGIVSSTGYSSSASHLAPALLRSGSSGFRSAHSNARTGVASVTKPRSSRPAIDVPVCSEASLRSAITGAMNGDTINMPMNCSLITLTAGAIPITVDDLNLVGPGAGAFTIDGGSLVGNYDHIFRHTGSGTLYISGMTITHGSLLNSMDPYGGCIDSDGLVFLSNSTVTQCSAESAPGLNAKGGAVYGKLGVNLYSSVVTLSEVRAPAGGNAAGGGVFSAGPFAMTYSTVSQNVATTPAGSLANGGGVYVWGGNVDVRYSTISDNQAQTGGGIFAFGSFVTAQVTNSTISGNYASAYVGGAVFLMQAILSNSTIASNTSGDASYGIGLYSQYTPTILSSILSNNLTPGQDVGVDVVAHTGLIDGEKNIIIHTPSAAPPDTIQACPRLGPLADNGGPTWTHAVLTGSPAIDAGSNPLNALYDQRLVGFPRRFGAQSDIGAYEWQGSPSDEIFSSRFEFACD